ncbi:PREDICTED: protein phosphatase 1L-like, partial [Phaethon lepturus]|uniref:protein phosphatase 1L-like n=1 Tax=Phaethon lepturus TaxID=97097 RepID=UPI000530A37A
RGHEGRDLHPKRAGIQPAFSTAFFTPFGAISVSRQRRHFLRRQLILLGSSGDPGGQVPLHALSSGTTCLIALLSDKELIVANVGDSRGVLCDKDGNAIPLSHDHKPYQLKERKRIKRAGGFISFNGSWRVQGILAMSRSLGDYPLKNLNVVIPDPDILTFDLDKLQPEFMILASDGLWDAFSNEEAVRFIKERLDEPHFGAKSIVLQSFYRGCPDNITVMVVKFRNSSKTEEQ